jgi:hypothetical protein
VRARSLALSRFRFFQPAAPQRLRRDARQVGLDVENRRSVEHVDAPNVQPWAVATEKPSMSVSPGSSSGRISRTPSASCFAPGPFGISRVSLNGLFTRPMGRISNMRTLPPSTLAFGRQRAAAIMRQPMRGSRAASGTAQAGPTASESAEWRLRRRSASARNGAVENVVTSAMTTIIAKIRGERIPSS